MAGGAVAGEAEPIEGDPIKGEVAVEEPVADPEADTIMVTSTGKTPDPS